MVSGIILRGIRGLVFLLILLLTAGPAFASDQQDYMRKYMEDLQRNGTVEVSGVTLFARAMNDIYQRHQYSPIWSSIEQVDALLRNLNMIVEDGLDPEDMNFTKLNTYREGITRLNDLTAHDRVEFDILLTEGLTRLIYQLIAGKVDPTHLDTDWNLVDKLDVGNPADILNDLITKGDVGGTVEFYRPKLPLYDALRSALANNRVLAEQENWDPVPAGPTLKEGMRGPRVKILRSRLVVSGDLPPGGGDNDVYDRAVVAAVKAFQARASLDVDGKAGRRTLEHMNISARARVDKLRVNLERVRWVANQLSDDFILTNIASFQVYLFKEGQAVWSSKVMVGKEYRKTPVFRSSMKYIVFNPTWTVPPGILRRSILPAIKKDPNYLASNNMKLIDSDGKETDPATIDWATMSTRKFRWSVVQQPGPDNALGEVKFIFPNNHMVFLHDTSHRELFTEASRAFSSGCIRVQYPLDLAVKLLDDQTGFSREAIDKIVRSGRSRTQFLSKPLPVLLMYLTAWRDPDGTVSYAPDIYGRDARVLTALNSEFRPTRTRLRD